MMNPLVKFVLLPLLLGQILSQSWGQGIVLAQTDVPIEATAIEPPAPAAVSPPAVAPPSEQPPPPASPPPNTLSGSQPTLVPLRGTEQIQLQLVNCAVGIDCALAAVILPASARINQYQLQFDNPATVPAQILNGVAMVRGTFTGYQLTDAFAVPAGAQTLSANQLVSLPLTLKRTAMPPDQYTGAIYFTLANQTNRLVLPVSLNVRRGPLIPIVVLLLGVVIGRLLKYMQEQGGPQAEMRQKLYQLEADLRSAHPDDQNRLAEMVKATRHLIYRHQLEAANAQIEAVRNRLDVLMQLRSIEQRLNEQLKFQDYVPDEAFQLIRQARLEIEQKRDAKAKEMLDQLIDTLSSAAPRGGTAGVGEIESTLKGAASNLDRNARNLAIARRQPTGFGRLPQILIDLSGLSEQVRAEATYWFVRPLLYVALLLGLTLVGLNTLYIEQGVTMGAKPLSDFIGLMLWGLSADVASRSLSGLQGDRESV